LNRAAFPIHLPAEDVKLVSGTARPGLVFRARKAIVETLPLKEWKRLRGGKRMQPREKVVEMVRLAMDARSKILFSSPPSRERESVKGLFVLEGKVNGQSHRILVQEFHGTDVGAAEQLESLAARKNSLQAKAAFACLPGRISGETLLLAQKLGIIPIADSENGEVLLAHLGPPTVVKHIHVQSWALSLLIPPAEGKGFTFDEKSPHLLLRGKPVRNWLCRESQKLIQKADRDCLISVRYRLQGPVAFMSRGTAMVADGLEAWFECRILNRVRSLRADLEEVIYHPRLGKILASAGSRGGKRARRPVTGPTQEDVPLLGTCPSPKPELHIYHPVTASADSGMPDLHREILATDISIKYG
jgi:hypothetical protein